MFNFIVGYINIKSNAVKLYGAFLDERIAKTFAEETFLDNLNWSAAFFIYDQEADTISFLDDTKTRKDWTWKSFKEARHMNIEDDLDVPVKLEDIFWSENDIREQIRKALEDPVPAKRRKL